MPEKRASVVSIVAMVCLAGGWTLFAGHWCAAAEPPAMPPSVLVPKDQAPAPVNVGDLLGQRFESRAAGITFRAPAGCEEIRRGGVDTIVQFLNEQRGWVLTASKTSLQHPRPLKDYNDDRGNKQLGLLAGTLEEFSHQHADAELLRQDVVTIADADVGVFAIRYYQGKDRKLLQQALIRQSDTLYYVLTLLSNASLEKGTPDDATKGNPDERMAVAVFQQVLDSVKLIERGSIRKEQEERLAHSREVLPSLKTAEAMKKVLLPEQYYRLLRDGKDIGYTCIFEEVGRRDAREGVLVSLRARTSADKTTADVLSQMFTSFGWREESWTHVAKSVNEKQQAQSSELGVSNLTKRVTVDRNAPATQIGEHYTPPVVEVEEYKLEVRASLQRTTEKGPISATGQPKNFTLPPWYVPQAVRQMLPRLLPLDRPQIYLFATYVGEQREVMARYVDVGAPATVNFVGKSQKVVPVYDRTGLEGSMTIHYLTPAGQYVGSTTTYTGPKPTDTMTVEVIATDAATLQRMWPGADLSKPRDADLARLK